MTIQALELAALHPLTGETSAAPTERLAALAGVKTELTVVAGTARCTVGQLLALRDGEVLPLNTALNAPFDLMLGDTLIARGELVAVGEHFGIRIVQTSGSEQPSA